MMECNDGMSDEVDEAQYLIYEQVNGTTADASVYGWKIPQGLQSSLPVGYTHFQFSQFSSKRNNVHFLLVTEMLDVVDAAVRDLVDKWRAVDVDLSFSGRTTEQYKLTEFQRFRMNLIL